MPKYSLNPDGSLKIEDESSCAFGSFARIIKSSIKVVSALLIVISVVIYGVVYYDNDKNEIIYLLLNGDSSRISSCYNIGIINQEIDTDFYYFENFSKKSIIRIEDGVEWIIDKIIEFREDAGY